MKQVLIVLISMFILGCSSKDSDSPNDGSGNDPVNTPPVSNSYLAPSNNQICTGAVISETTIAVDFQWLAFQDAEDTTLNYTLRITEHATGTTAAVQNISSTTAQVMLQKGTTYSWNVSATDTQGATVTGSTWQFQTPFDAVGNYAPFPATLLSPSNGQVFSITNITFNWEGNDPDPGETDALLYDLYVSTSETPTLLASDLVTTSYTTNLSSGIYVWKIVSKDPSGNESSSQWVQFEVQ